MASIKEKIAAVRAVVSDRSNDQIVLVLQHHDGDADKTIADFLEGNADDILTEWQHAGQNKSAKAKKRKKKLQQKKAKAQAQAAETAQSNEETKPLQLTNGHNEDSGDIKNGTLNNAEAATALKLLLTDSKTSSNEKNSTSNSPEINPSPPPVVNGTSDAAVSAEVAKAIKQQQFLYHGGRRSRTSSETSTKSAANKKKHKNTPSNLVTGNQHATNGQTATSQHDTGISANKKSIEKAVKDLQRCTVSYGRYKNLLNGEIQDSYKRIKQTFEALTNALMDREVQLIRNLDEIKNAAFELMAKREAQAHELKRQTDRVDAMSHQQLNDLRSEIKHFVAERKFDEELGRTSRFTFDPEILSKVIPSFGEITGIKNSYTPRTQTESAASYTSDSGTSFPVAPVTAKVSPATKPSSSHTPPSQLPITDPIQPAADSSRNKAQIPVPDLAPTSNDKAKEIANGHVEDWAAESSDLPLPESPASWASGTPLLTPDGTFKENSMGTPQPQRTQRRDRNKKGSVSDKDQDLMPPPDQIPSSRGGSAPAQNEMKRDRSGERSSSNHNNTSRNYRSQDYKASGDRAQQFRDKPRGGYRGYRGGYRGNRGGSYRGSYHGPPRGEQQPFSDRSNDYGSRPPSGQYRNDRGGRGYDNRPSRGQYGGNKRYNDDNRNQKFNKSESDGPPKNVNKASEASKPVASKAPTSSKQE
uniref:SPATS2-like protein n=1 Tax=Phallusia mammillata TaxID=59560 RepID=A0A6F9DU34_9ASCI|nr:SPATS2-like protein [Phallusia mammillata]